MAEENFESVLEHLSEDQLREELTQRELDTTGDRDELITRIEKYDQSENITFMLLEHFLKMHSVISTRWSISKQDHSKYTVSWQKS